MVYRWSLIVASKHTMELYWFVKTLNQSREKHERSYHINGKFHTKILHVLSSNHEISQNFNHNVRFILTRPVVQWTVKIDYLLFQQKLEVVPDLYYLACCNYDCWHAPLTKQQANVFKTWNPVKIWRSNWQPDWVFRVDIIADGDADSGVDESTQGAEQAAETMEPVKRPTTSRIPR